jgi:hypothetical protein
MATIYEMLQEMVEIYAQKTEAVDLSVQFKLIPDEKDWYLRSKPGEHLKIEKTKQDEPQIIFTFSEETLTKIYSGEMTGLTAMGRENISDQTPLDFALGKDMSMTPALMEKLLAFVQRFFNPTHPEKILFNKSASRLVHGGWGIPMFYHSGFRSGWYQLDKGQKLNKPGDVNPFHQAFVIISGKGYTKIGENSIEVRTGEAYYIPPQSEHILWNNEPEPLCLIYLAWGENA